MPVQGLHLITPSAAVATGTGSSATINTNGSVTFSAVNGLQLRGVFSADYDNYQIVCRTTRTGGTGTGLWIYMMSGTSRNTTSNYVAQLMQVASTTITGSRTAAETSAQIGYISPTRPHGFTMFVYGPHLAQPTVGRSLMVDGTDSGKIYESAWSHNVSSAFDGIELWFNNNTGESSAGLVCVYGMRK